MDQLNGMIINGSTGIIRYYKGLVRLKDGQPVKLV